MFKKTITKLFFATFMLLFIFVGSVSADGLLKTGENGTQSVWSQSEALGDQTGFEQDTDIGTVVASVINAVLSLLGVIFIVLIIIGGWKWMMARGNEDQVKEAGDTIRRAIVGLIIVVSAYAITYFVFENIDFGAEGGGGGNSATI